MRPRRRSRPSVATGRGVTGSWSRWRRRRLRGLLRRCYVTLRVRYIDPHGVLEAHARGARVIWAAWHDGIALLPLMVVRVHRAFRPRVALSWHRDAEIAAQAVRRFGVAATRGSATRGWLGAMRGLLAAHARGEDLVVIPDGPRGPRHRSKRGWCSWRAQRACPWWPSGSRRRRAAACVRGIGCSCRSPSAGWPSC